ncbi:MAG: 4Fe-4S dicluster domain-containing protein [Gammaproteobacteria bacterium]
MGLFKGRINDGSYTPALLHRWLRPAISGNAINGLGETAARRPTPIYHWFIHRPRYPFKWVEWIFILNNSRIWKGQKLIFEAMDYLKLKPAPIATQRVEGAPLEWSQRIKEFALANGADAVGITRMQPEWVFEGHEVTEPWIVMLGFHPDYEVFKTVPQIDGALETLRTYNRGHRTAVKLADWIRGQGWHAEGYGAPFASKINLIPPAIEAGLGELGKHGSIINRRYGSAFRLAYVVTELPLSADAPDSFGVDDFCSRCQVCSKACPPDAILPEKQLVRGTEKWYVDFDKCLPYFNDTLGCGICIAVCPWSLPGIGDNLVRKLSRRREKTPAATISAVRP